ncbi:hypothetical protein ASE07_21245 [Noviherbaspirillum sp. Root189]|nr:SUMF1/EgtB/PvdO family nonheme iron enzyme [Noviherbaspirillum sp. Root189]KRB85231.1 hypothetical protein ASE07_21245 [Noviherbaspirillum sp. Root189]
MWRKLFIVSVLVAMVCGSAVGAQLPRHIASDDGRLPDNVALVIGNGAYPTHSLPNAGNDARAVAAQLTTLGYDVILYEDLDRAGLQRALDQFKDRLIHADVGLFYFSGHGVRVGPTTYLLPLDADSNSLYGMQSRTLNLDSILASMRSARPDKPNIVMLDTCLNDPFKGLGIVRPDDPRATVFKQDSSQTLVAYATSPGAFAADGISHGVFTSQLLHAMRQPDADVQTVLRQVQASVAKLTAQRQVPVIEASLAQPITLRGTSPSAEVAMQSTQAMPMDNEQIVAWQSRGVLPKDSAEQYELTFWESIKDSTHASDYEAYLQSYPNGRFASLARARMERLRAAAPKADTPADKPPPAVRSAPERPRAPAAKAQEQPRPEPPKKAEPETAATPKPPEPRPAEKPAAPAQAGSEIRDCPTCPVLVSVRAGGFTMGSAADDPSERPPHRVTINTPFAIGKYEVTVEQWDACVAAGACPRITAGEGRQKKSPARDISWDDAQLYVKWLSSVSGKTYRLPSEAEWEYAVRGGTSTRFWWGDQMRPGNANCKDCGDPWQKDAPSDVGSFAPNPYGLHDMNGSVWEWVSDCWHNTYKGAPADARSWDEPNCRVRVIRGGSWREGATYMPSSTRFKYDASVRHSQNGFRVVRELN